MDFVKRRALYLFLLHKLGLPRSATGGLVRGLARLSEPKQARVRRQLAETMASDQPRTLIPEQAGFRIFQPDEFPGTEALVQECRDVFEQSRKAGLLEERSQDASKRFLVPVAPSPADLLQRPAIREFVFSKELLSVVTRYLGRVPILSELQLLWTPVNDTKLKSQKYHLDTEDERQLKVFVNIFDVTPDHGPFTLIPAEESSDVCRSSGYNGGRDARLEDDDVERAHTPISCLGVAGSSLFVDTSRCLHYGSRGNRGERLVLLIQFIDYYAPKLRPTDWSSVASSIPVPDATRRLLLRGQV